MYLIFICMDMSMHYSFHRFTFSILSSPSLILWWSLFPAYSESVFLMVVKIFFCVHFYIYLSHLFFFPLFYNGHTKVTSCFLLLKLLFYFLILFSFLLSRSVHGPAYSWYYFFNKTISSARSLSICRLF